MIFEHTRVNNFDNAFRGLRNPLESWHKSDSWGGIVDFTHDYILGEMTEKWIENENSIREKNGQIAILESQHNKLWSDLFDKYCDWLTQQGILKIGPHQEACEVFYIGPKDLDLAQRMIKAGSSDRKFLRQILISVDITAPLYWWKEFDTYKIGTTANSTSTMHRLTSTPITKQCFEMGDFAEDLLMYENEPYNPDIYFSEYWDMLINDLEFLRKQYNKTKDKRYWKELIRLLPNGWLQTRTVTMNYEILRNIYTQRRKHRLVEWHKFCDWVNTLPYAKELITYNID